MRRLTRIVRAASLLPRSLYRAALSRFAPERLMRHLGVEFGSGGRYLSVSPRTFGSEPYLISLGDRVTITADVRFVTHDGGVWVGRDRTRGIDVIAPIRVGSNVFLGLGAIVLPGITIGDDVVVGAGSVVTRDLPSGAVYAGSPAKRIRDVDSYIERSLSRDLGTKQLSRAEKRDVLKRRFAA